MSGTGPIQVICTGCGFIAETNCGAAGAKRVWTEHEQGCPVAERKMDACLCGCGKEVWPGRRWVNGTHANSPRGRAVRRAQMQGRDDPLRVIFSDGTVFDGPTSNVLRQARDYRRQAVAA